MKTPEQIATEVEDRVNGMLTTWELMVTAIKADRDQRATPWRRNVLLSQGMPTANVTVRSAQSLFSNFSIDYPVSGDETLKGYGYIGIRQRHINIWHSIELRSVLQEVEL